MPLFQFNDMNNKEFGDAKLIRKRAVKPFKYEKTAARKFTINDGMQGYITVKATQSIKTHDELNFVRGDKIQLDTSGSYAVVANFTKDVNDKQLTLLKSDYSVTYTLDLE